MKMNPKGAEHYRKALKIVPWATQTNAKRIAPEQTEFLPAFIKRAQGCRIWDLDDNEYIDYRCALGPIILGYRHPEVDEAVEKQLRDGVLFSMASPLEFDAAESILENVPSLEQIRFMKTGADACTSCIRLARVHTKRDHILTSGYHGYHDWFVSSWPNSGVPSALREYVHEISYGDIEAAERVFEVFGEQLAAAIVEPHEWNQEASPTYLKHLRRKCDEAGALLIFDEVLTGFRLARGGAQEYFNVTPDLTAFAKAMGNGYPLSAFAGKEQYMQNLSETIITTTYGGEALSLAACKATMKVMRGEPVNEHICEVGGRLHRGFAEIINETGVPAVAAGLPPTPFIRFASGDDSADKSRHDRFFSKLFESGVFPNDPWFVSYSHQVHDIDETLDKVRTAMKEIS